MHMPLAHGEIWGLSFDCIEGEVDASLAPCISYKCMGGRGCGGGMGWGEGGIGGCWLNLDLNS